MNRMSNCSNIIDTYNLSGDYGVFQNISLLINETDVLQCILDGQSNYTNQNYTELSSESQVYHTKWIYLIVFLFVIAGGLGNILVCLSVALDKNLQNVTNYFLFSLAVADLLVSLFVMPLSAIPAFLGKKLTLFYR